MKKFFVCLTLCFGIIFASTSTTQAIISETADLAIEAAAGLMQTDDEKLEREIIAGLQNPAEQENLRNYVEKTRPIIQSKTNFFGGTLTPALAFMSKVPLVGGMATSATITGYVMKYEHDLAKGADSEVLKKFVELREHNIEAGKGLFEVFFDFMMDFIITTDKSDKSVDATLLYAKSEQQRNRYKSSAAAIARVLEAAGIAMQPEDVGDICQRTSKDSKPAPSSSPTQTQTPAPTPQTNNPPPQPSASKADNAISIGGVSLGDSKNSVSGKYGQPTEKDVSPSGYDRLSYGSAFAVDFNHDAAACLISYSPNYSTSRGIHVGSTIENVVSAYGDNYSIYRNGGLEMYEYFSDFGGKEIITRFAFEEGQNSVKYISIRYAK